ncbi:MAG: hypothetical protein IKO94_10140 [Selenomonadaceae bacterium]|nr:hypothetical protein [Selenomonadaceae bacterium]
MILGICCRKCCHVAVIRRDYVFHLAGCIQDADHIGLQGIDEGADGFRGTGFLAAILR